MGHVDNWIAKWAVRLPRHSQAIQGLLRNGPLAYDTVDLRSLFVDLSEFNIPTRSNVIIGAREDPSLQQGVSEMFSGLEEMSAQGRLRYGNRVARVLRIPLDETERTPVQYKQQLASIADIIAGFLDQTYPGRFDDGVQRLRDAGCVGETLAMFRDKGADRDIFGNLVPLMYSDYAVGYNVLPVLNRFHTREGMDKLVLIWDLWQKPLSLEDRSRELDLINMYIQKNGLNPTAEEKRAVAKGGWLIANMTSLTSACLDNGPIYHHIIASPMYGFDAIFPSVHGAEWANFGAGDEILDDMSRIPIYRF